MSERSPHSQERVPLDGPQAQEITPSLSDAEAHRLVEKAIESVLDQVPETPDMEAGDGEAVDRSQKSQPWAETAAPPAKNKRPLEELVAEFMASVAENPDARAGKPNAKHPAAAFFERFSRSPRGPARQQERQRGHHRRHEPRPSGDSERGRAAVEPSTAAQQGSRGQAHRRKRRRRRRPSQSGA